MNALADPLWNKIASFRLDDPDARFSFSQRLARDHGWTLSYAVRVVEEYRRFVYLAMTAGHAVTPSEQVDQAWHLHLIYSYSYWTEFCGETLGRSFHHGPTKGGPAEVAKHDDWYRRTLESYEAAFGHPAPPDIWADAEERFSPDHRWQRLDRRDCWVIPKPRYLGKAAQWALLGASGLLLTSCLTSQFAGIPLLGIPGPGTEIPLLGLRGPEFIKIYLVIAVSCIGIAILIRVLRGQVDSTGGVPPSDPYVIALLTGGRTLAVGAAATELHRRKLLDVLKKPWAVLPGGDAQNLHPFEARVLQMAGQQSSIPKLVKSLDLDLATMEGKLESQNFLLPKEKANQTRLMVLCVVLIPLVLGGLKLWMGLSRGYPSGFLGGAEMMTFFIGLVLTLQISRRTSEGSAVLKSLRQNLAHLKSDKVLTMATGEASQELPLAMAVFGASVLTLTPLSPLRTHLGLVTSDSSSGGDGGGCGGGGGGCGGCGGGN